MATIQENKAIVGRWFTEFWGNPWNPAIIDELAAPDMLLQYSLTRRGRAATMCAPSCSGFAPRFPIWVSRARPISSPKETT